MNEETVATVQQIAAANGLLLPRARAAALAPFWEGLLAADARLAALDLGGLPVVGMPWEAWRPEIGRPEGLGPAEEGKEGAGDGG